MAVRVRSADVREVIETELRNLSAFITAASNLTDRVAAADSGVTAATLFEIERWLAAHFTAIRERQEQSSDVGDTTFIYGGKTAMGLEFTRFGQQALAFDPTGTLRKMDLRKAGISYLGREAVDGVMKET